jgi:VIT1/CCC1 family predicted Fe2+/Mn2+ transporter
MSNPLESWNEEQRSALLYRVCADAEADNPRSELFRRLAGEAEAQAAIWRAQLTARGHPAPAPYVPDARTRLVMALVQKLGPRRMKTMLAAMKSAGWASTIFRFRATPATRCRGPAAAPSTGTGACLAAATCAPRVRHQRRTRLECESHPGRRRASPDAHVVLLTGIAGMCAGAFAMATGEYVSVRSQRELFEYQIGLERDELAQYPEAEAQELALIYTAKGLRPDEASKLATKIIADPKHALDTLAREELGLNPAELGSPWGAAISSFLSFAVGALLPLAPFMVMSARARPGRDRRPVVTLFAVRALLSPSPDAARFARLRMLALGGLAGAVTFAVGHLAETRF